MLRFFMLNLLSRTWEFKNSKFRLEVLYIVKQQNREKLLHKGFYLHDDTEGFRVQTRKLESPGTFAIR